MLVDEIMSELTSPTISTRFLVLSDTHNFDFDDNTAISSPLCQPLPKVDVLLHCGDLTHCGGSSSYKKALKMLGAIDAELKLVIAGNHDLDLDKRYWNSHLYEDDEPEDHFRAIKVMKGRLAVEAGVKYLEEGTYTFTLNNEAKLTVYASPYSPAFCDWAFAYEHAEDRFNEAHQVGDEVKSIAKHPIPNFPDVDIIMTHGPPRGILDECPQGNVGCKNLLQALRRAKPRMHCFGHIHEGKGATTVDWESEERGLANSRNRERENSKDHSTFGNVYPKPTTFPSVHGKQSLMINAAIMDESNEPKNPPWLIDLELPRAASKI